MRITYKFKPQGPVLEQYTNSTARVALIIGPLGSAKTWASCEKLFKVITRQRPNAQKVRKTRIVAVRNTYPDLTGTTIKDWLSLYGELGRYTEGGLKPPTHNLHFRLEDGTIVQSELIFIALDRPIAVRKLRGIQCTAFWLNEVKELQKSIIDMCDLRHGRYPSKLDGGPSWHGMFGDSNAPDDDHFLYEWAEVSTPPGWEIFKQPGGVLREYTEVNGRRKWTGKWLPNYEAENINNLPKNYYIDGMAGKSNDWIAVQLGNEYGHYADGRPVYAESWNPQMHVDSSIEYNADEPLYVGLDYGRTPASVFVQFIDGRLHVLDELTTTNMSVRAFSKLLAPKVNGLKPVRVEYVGDKSASNKSQATDDSPESVLAEQGINVTPDMSAEIQTRLGAVEFFLESLHRGAPVFRIHPKCKTLIKGFSGGYHFNRVQVVGEERYSDKPSKNRFSHPHDALQSVCMYLRGSAESKPFVRSTARDKWGH